MKPPRFRGIIHQHAGRRDVARLVFCNQLIAKRTDLVRRVWRIHPYPPVPRLRQTVFFDGEKGLGPNYLIGRLARRRVEVDFSQDKPGRFDIRLGRVPLAVAAIVGHMRFENRLGFADG